MNQHVISLKQWLYFTATKLYDKDIQDICLTNLLKEVNPEWEP
jgi:hypothetical protein